MGLRFKMLKRNSQMKFIKNRSSSNYTEHEGTVELSKELHP